MFSVNTYIYNKKTKGPTLMEYAVSPVVHTLNISRCQKKKLFQFSCGCEKLENIMKRPVCNILCIFCMIYKKRTLILSICSNLRTVGLMFVKYCEFYAMEENLKIVIFFILCNW